MIQGLSLKQRAEKKGDVDELVNMLMHVLDKKSSKVHSRSSIHREGTKSANRVAM